MGKRTTAALLCAALALSAAADGPQRYTAAANAHSHNDYSRPVPFYQAYCAGFGSIEADIYLEDGKLLVGHNREDLRPERTLEALYLDPIRRETRLHGGSACPEGRSLRLLIDLKTEGASTLRALERTLMKYRDCFDPEKNPRASRVVVTGDCPAPEDFGKYAPFILFDGRPGADYTPEQLKRVDIISDNYKAHASWRGKGRMPNKDYDACEALIAKAHALGKPMRLWGSPDTRLAWETFREMGLDLLNTDHPTLMGLWLDGVVKDFDTQAAGKR